MLRWLSLALVLVCVLTLRTLKNESLGSNYKIGRISDLYFGISERIFFRCEDDLFGLISQSDGSLLSVY